MPHPPFILPSLDRFFHLSPDLCCVRDTAGYFQQVSDRWTATLGWSIAELTERPWIEFIHPDDVADTDVHEQDAQQPDRQTPVTYKNRFRHRDGSYRWLAWRVDSYQEGLSAAIAQDATESQWRGSQQYRRGLSATLKLRDQALAASSVGIVMADARLPDMPLIYVNPAFETMTGYSASDVLGTNCRFLQGDKKQQPGLEVLRQAIQRQRNCTAILLNFRKDGTPFWNELTISPIFDEAGRLTHFVGIQVDVTLRVQAEQSLRQEQQKSEQLLLNVLPKPIVTQLKERQGTLAQQFPAATILFVDLVDFTTQASQLSALVLVETLNQIFSAFDRLAAEHGVEKIKTIGDAYMVVAGLPLPQSSHVSAIADLALAMRKVIQDFTWPGGEAIQLRMGIHTGAVVAGVIGINKFSYDLWGDTVNIAARMEQSGEPGQIQVTPAVYQQLRDNYHFEMRGQINIKGKGEMMTYWLQGYQSESPKTNH
ncbi:MAG: PAS domain S-box protein [Spirulina sp. SIO3F2]|nr:PAS domain S-box protein [Spirulina sp. SIO3F2]